MYRPFFSSKYIAEAGLPVYACFLKLRNPRKPVIIPKKPDLRLSKLDSSFGYVEAAVDGLWSAGAVLAASTGAEIC